MEPLVIAVSKGQSVDAIKKLYDKGYRDFGENRLQELDEKEPLLPKDIRWHFIGTLQTKKVPKIIGRCVLIHSVDSVKLAEKIAKVSQEKSVVTKILLEVNTSQEPSKHGFNSEEVVILCPIIQQFQGIEVCGLMTMAPQMPKATQDEVRACFRTLNELRQKLNLKELSMGMSDDYEIAKEEGATIIRLGRKLFAG